MFELVHTSTVDNLLLYGLYVAGDKNKPVILHIHGFEGDFFTNGFIKPLAHKLKEQNTAFLTVQTRGMGSEYLLKTKDNKWKRYGAHYEIHADAYKDIDAWINFLTEKGYTQIILQGHSLGTMKVIRYLFQGTYPHTVKKLILLAPFDNIYMAENFASGKWKKYVMAAQQKVKEGKGEEIMPKEYWDIEISYQTYVSWLEDNEYTNMFNFYNKEYSFPTLNRINIPVKVIVGTKDEFFHSSNPSRPQEAIDIMQKNIKDFSYCLIEEGDHGYTGKEDILINEIIKFLK